MAQIFACFFGPEDKIKKIEKLEAKLLAEMNVLERRIQQQNYMAGRAYYEQNDLFAARRCWKTNKILRTRYARLETKLVKLQNKRIRLGMNPSSVANRATPIVVVDPRTHHAFRNSLESNSGGVSMAKVVNELANLHNDEGHSKLTTLAMGQPVKARRGGIALGAKEMDNTGAEMVVGSVPMLVTGGEQDEDLFASFDMVDIDEEGDKNKMTENR